MTDWPVAQRRLICSRCGAAFTCGAGGRDGRCWCADEPRVPMPTSTDQDCTCPACLRAHALQMQTSTQR